MKFMIIAGVCVLVLACSIPSSALLGIPQVMEGTVESVAEDLLTVSHSEENSVRIVEFQVTDETQFEDALISLDNLNQGDNVQIKYKSEGDSNIAVSISRGKGEPVENLSKK